MDKSETGHGNTATDSNEKLDQAMDVRERRGNEKKEEQGRVGMNRRKQGRGRQDLDRVKAHQGKGVRVEPGEENKE